MTAAAAADPNTEVIVLKTGPAKPKREIFEVLDGLRVLLTLWVVSFHTLWHIAMFVDQKIFNKIYFDDTNHLLSGGLNGVDYFFVLTGFLVAYPIFRGARTGTWFEFVWMRVTRVYPLLITSMFVFCGIMSNWGRDPYLIWEQHVNHALRPVIDEGQGSPSLGLPNNCHLGWTNLLFINNFVPFGGCMGWTWSLCIQVHFFLIFPLVIKWFGRGKGFLWFSAISTMFWFALRYFIYTAAVAPHLGGESNAPMYIYTQDQIAQFFVMFNIWYAATPQRIGCCFGGVLLAYFQATKPTWLTKLHKNIVVTTLMTILISVGIFFSFAVDFNRPWQAIFFSVGSPGHVLCIAVLYYLLINNIGPLSIITPFLKLKIWSHLAYPSYGVYLAHSYIIVWLFRQPWLKPLVAEDGSLSNLVFAKHCLLVFVCAWTYAYLATRFVEEPIKGFLRKYVDPVPKPQQPVATTDEKKID